MQSPRSIEVKVGVLILTAVSLLAAFVLVMGGYNFQPTYAIFVDFDNPGGLQTGAPIKIAGVKVGKIGEISFRGGLSQWGETPQTPRSGLQTGHEVKGQHPPLVRLKVLIEKRYAQSLHDNALFYVTNQSVLGEQFLAVEPGSSDRPVLADGAIMRGLDPPRLDMLIAEVYDLLHAAVSTIHENKAEIGEAFEGLRKTLKGTGELMEKNQGRLDRIAENVEKITVDADDLVKGARAKFVDSPQIDRIIAGAEKVSDDAARDLPPILADGKVAVAGARRVAETLGDPQAQVKLKQTLDDVAAAASRAKTMTGDASEIVSHIRRGKGTVGAVVMDEQLFDDMQELLRDLKHNPWKFFWRE